MATGNSHTLPAGYWLLDGYEIVETVHLGVASIEYTAYAGGVRVSVEEYFPARLAVREGENVLPVSDAAEAEFHAGLTAFLATARILSGIKHANIVDVYECTAANGTGYIVTEEVPGESLADLVDRRGTLPPRDVVDVMRPLVQGLGVVHEHGVTHRQINPDAIVIGADGAAVLRGFGHGTKVVGGPRQVFEERSVRLADITPGYTALEQYSAGGREGPWTDIYALAAVMYHCVTGEQPADAPHRAVRDHLAPVLQPDMNADDARMLSAIDSALAVPIASRPQSLPVWRALLFGDAEHKLLPHRAGRTSARGFHRPVTSTSVALGRVAQSDPMGGEGTSSHPLRRALQWSVPAALATVLMAVITWVDTGVLRTAETAESAEAGPVVGVGSVPGAPLGEGEFADALQSGGVGPTMIRVPEGSMRVPCWPPGCTVSEAGAGEEIVFEQSFGLSKYEITKAEFALFVAATGHASIPAVQADGQLPMVNVSWRDAVTYTEWLSEQTGREYRLSSEAEWEYAARAGREALTGRFDGVPESDRGRGAARVGSAPPNEWGFHDMHDNVSEWVIDCERVDAQVDEEQPQADCLRHVQRGSSWVHSLPNAGAASRALTDADVRTRDIGFRVAVLGE